jgi:hypothetical protein
MRHLALILTFLFTPTALARGPVPEEHWDDEAKLTLAQALVGEADWRHPDHLAIAWVLAKRFRVYRRTHPGVSFAQFIRFYSSPLKPFVKTSRARAIRALTWGQAGGKWGGKRWLKVQRTVERWGRGVENDPCPSALHWGGDMDKAPKPTALYKRGWRITSCTGGTANTFYEPIPGRRQQS